MDNQVELIIVNDVDVAAEQTGAEPRRAVELRSAREIQDLAPSPYGTFGIVYNGALLAQTPLSAKKLIQRLKERGKESQG